MGFGETFFFCHMIVICREQSSQFKNCVTVNRNQIQFVFPAPFFHLRGFSFFQVMVDESFLSDDPDSYVTLTVVRSPGGKGAVRLQWTVDEMAKDELSPLNGTLHFDEVQSASGLLQFFSNFLLHSITYINLCDSIHYVLNFFEIINIVNKNHRHTDTQKTLDV